MPALDAGIDSITGWNKSLLPVKPIAKLPVIGQTHSKWYQWYHWLSFLDNIRLCDFERCQVCLLHAEIFTFNMRSCSRCQGIQVQRLPKISDNCTSIPDNSNKSSVSGVLTMMEPILSDKKRPVTTDVTTGIVSDTLSIHIKSNSKISWKSKPSWKAKCKLLKSLIQISQLLRHPEALRRREGYGVIR